MATRYISAFVINAILLLSVGVAHASGEMDANKKAALMARIKGQSFDMTGGDPTARTTTRGETLPQPRVHTVAGPGPAPNLGGAQRSSSGTTLSAQPIYQQVDPATLLPEHAAQPSTFVAPNGNIYDSTSSALERGQALDPSQHYSSAGLPRRVGANPVIKHR